MSEFETGDVKSNNVKKQVNHTEGMTRVAIRN